MILLEDTRQQEHRHKAKHDYFRSKGIHCNRTALYCGDYTLPANQSICVDTKKDIGELIGDVQVKQMTKRDVLEKVNEICITNDIALEDATAIYNVICDDDSCRFAEKDINDICYKIGIAESVVAKFQALYVKRHGFFHRGLKRAQNSQIKLYILVANDDGVRNLDDLFLWRNPRLNIWRNSNEVIGFWKNGRPRYKKVQKYPSAMTGERLAKACCTMELKYGCGFAFCSPEEQGEKVLELLGIEV